MGIQEISEILKSKYPDWMTAEKITEQLSNSLRNTNKCLSRMKHRHEVDLLVAHSRLPHGKIKTYYRHKTEEKTDE